MYGAILVKIWRVYQIFHNKSPEIGVSILYFKSETNVEGHNSTKIMEMHGRQQ